MQNDKPNIILDSKYLSKPQNDKHDKPDHILDVQYIYKVNNDEPDIISAAKYISKV